LEAAVTTKSPPQKQSEPRRYGQRAGSQHIDRRAGRLLAEPISEGPDDELLTTKQMSEWWGYSEQWFEIARHKNKGPRFVVMGDGRGIRYRRGTARAYLRKREHQGTAEYRTAKSKSKAEST
jgi:hypothetical protein